jgi:hypothetical protein
MSSPTSPRRDLSSRLSVVNLAIAAVLGAALAVALARQFWSAALIILAIDVGGLSMAWYARRHGRSDLGRVEALEPSDERERRILTHGLAGVGAAALVISVLAFLLALLADGRTGMTTYPMIGLMLVWAISNRVARART